MSTTGGALREIWRWLPVFRGVAETQSVSRAGRALGASPSAVSRSLAQLEKVLGRQLFDRRGRKLVLNPYGEKLLAALREADAKLGDALASIVDRETSGVVRLGAMGHYGRVFLVKAARQLARSHPKVQLSIVHLAPEVALARLQESGLDLFLGANIAVGEPLTAIPLADLEVSIYVGKGHPLFSGPLPTVEALLQHGFVAQHKPALVKPVWPKHLERRVTLWAESHPDGLAACLEGGHVICMERLIAQPYVDEGRLRELPLVPLVPLSLVLLRRLDADQPLLAEVIERVASVVRRDTRPRAP